MCKKLISSNKVDDDDRVCNVEKPKQLYKPSPIRGLSGVLSPNRSPNSKE
ncbi:hypothetical protein Scep_021617 [Stephania cephalantha]|uniref:Uncharacterized protein n=1 Tax=Stephania cephalantha TaxID=152367 RepID=A0AAP0HX03_9MAGN